MDLKKVIKMIKKEASLEKVKKLGECELGKECQKCNEACQQGSGCFTHDQIEEVANFLDISEEELKDNFLETVTKFNTTLYRPKIERKENKPYGKCIFWDEQEKCKIHEVKPLECKIATHKDIGEELSVWFMLNYFVDKHDPESIRQWAQYIESGGKIIPGGSLKELVKDEKRLKKILNYEKLGGLENAKEKTKK